MRLVHETGGIETVLASDVEVADTRSARIRGLMGRSELPEGYAMYFPFDSVRTRGVHMFFVRTALDVVWLVDDVVKRVKTLPAWFGHGRARGDAFVELPAGAARGVSAGDTLRLEGRT